MPEDEYPDWVNPMITSRKENGKVRICIDSRELNKAIIPCKYSLPTVDEIVAKMPNAKYFSKLDATSGFHQIQLSEESKKICAFNTHMGLFRYKRLPFGLVDASEIFQRVMDGHYRDLAQPLIDDILVHGATIEEHDRNLKKVLDRTRDIGLKLNPNKMVIGATSIKFAGVIISGESVHPDPDKVKAIREMVEPKNREELKSFLGMCSYLGKFIPRLADKAEPLNTINREKSQFKWTKIRSIPKDKTEHI